MSDAIVVDVEQPAFKGIERASLKSEMPQSDHSEARVPALRAFKYLVTMSAVLLLALAGSVVANHWVVENSKESHVQDGGLLASADGKSPVSIEVAQTELFLSDLPHLPIEAIRNMKRITFREPVDQATINKLISKKLAGSDLEEEEKANFLRQNIDPKDLTQETVADVCAITKSATSLIVELCGADGRRLEFDEKTFSIHTKDSSQLSTWSVSNFPLCGTVLLAKVYLDPNELVGVLRDQRRRLSQEACGEADPNLSSPIVVQPAYEAEAELDTHGRRLPAEAEPATHGRRLAGAPQGGAGYTFALPGNQAYNILPGNLYLPAQNSGYTVTYQKSRRLKIETSDEDNLKKDAKKRLLGAKKRRLPNTTGQGISAPRPGGYAFTLPANQKIVINPGNLQLPGNAEGYSIIYANSS